MSVYKINKGKVLKMVYKAQGVCARDISFDVKDGKVSNVYFNGGGPGSHLGIASLVEGMDVDEAIARLDGVPCGMRSTSCPDQLAQALKAYKAQL